jgi:hypothetical protein
MAALGHDEEENLNALIVVQEHHRLDEESSRVPCPRA